MHCAGPLLSHNISPSPLVHVVICTVIPAPPTVIPAQAGIYVCGGTDVGRTNTPCNRHSGASRNLCVQGNGRRAHQIPPPTVFRLAPESMLAGERASCAPIPPTIVIPAKAGIYVCRETGVGRANTPCNRHSGESRNDGCRLHYSSRRLQRWIPAKKPE